MQIENTFKLFGVASVHQGGSTQFLVLKTVYNTLHMFVHHSQDCQDCHDCQDIEYRYTVTVDT